MSKTWKTIITLVVIAIVITGGVLGYKYVKGLIDDNISLGIQKNSLVKLVEEKEAERVGAFQVVDSLSAVIKEADEKIAVKEGEIFNLQDSLDNIPIIVENITPEARYDSLEAIYVDTTLARRKYRFTENQVKEIYADVLRVGVLKGLNEKLIDTNHILQAQVDTGKELEKELRGIIRGYEEETAALHDYISNSEAKQIRVRTQRNVFGAIAAGGAIVIGILIAK